MTFLQGKPEFPEYTEIAGTPEEIIQGSRSWPTLPLETLWARCLVCWQIQAVGRYVYDSELVMLPDGSPMTASDWKIRAAKAAYGKGWRVKVHCYECEGLTEHIPVKK